MLKNKRNKYNKKVIISVLIMVVVLILGIAYAWLTQILNSNKSQVIKASSLELALDDRTSTGINLEYAIPEADTDGLKHSAYTFRVINNGNSNVGYVLYLDDQELQQGESRIPDKDIRYSLTRNNSHDEAKTLSATNKIVNSNTVRELDDTIINAKTYNTYTLKLWINSSADTSVMNKVFRGKLRLEGTQTEDTSSSPGTPIE